MQSALDAAIKRFTEKHRNSRRIFETAQSCLPGGNTRTTLYTAPFPISLARGDAYRVFDEDGNGRVTFVPQVSVCF